MTVGEVSKLAGITVRTLQYYDRIGLLCPRRSDSGYRMYSADDMQRLQEISKYKKMDIALEKIRMLLDDEHCDKKAIFSEHLRELERRKGDVQSKIEMVKCELDEI